MNSVLLLQLVFPPENVTSCVPNGASLWLAFQRNQEATNGSKSPVLRNIQGAMFLDPTSLPSANVMLGVQLAPGGKHVLQQAKVPRESRREHWQADAIHVLSSEKWEVQLLQRANGNRGSQLQESRKSNCENSGAT